MDLGRDVRKLGAIHVTPCLSSLARFPLGDLEEFGKNLSRDRAFRLEQQFCGESLDFSFLGDLDPAIYSQQFLTDPFGVQQ
jgi:hypothetical protein